MKKIILINSTSDENRIAIIEDGRLSELFYENPEYERVVGDIYLGKVAKVIPGLKAAFIDLGFKQDAFLHFSDVGEQVEEFGDLFGIEADEDEEDEEDKPQQHNHSHHRTRREPPKLERGQKIIVQITKEPVGNKGVRVTTKVAIPGRYLVFLPFESKVNASKQIDNPREKRRLKNIVRNYRSHNGLDFGSIIRTVAEEQDELSIIEDLQNLLKTWNNIEKNAKT